MSRPWLCSIVFVSSVVAGGVGCESVTSPQPWSTTCSRNADCTLMPFGDQCRSCAEFYDAVSVGEVDAILLDAEGAGGNCPFWTDWTAEVCAPQPTIAPVCVEGACTTATSGEPCAPAGRGLCQGVD